MRQAFDDLFSDLFNWRTPEMMAPVTWLPAIDLYEEGTNLVLDCVLPGLQKDEISVVATSESLTITGEFKRRNDSKGEGYHARELSSGRYYRKVRLPHPVQTAKVRASLDQGMLKIVMPMVEELKPRAIQIPVE